MTNGVNVVAAIRLSMDLTEFAIIMIGILAIGIVVGWLIRR